jgi:hypothetical protein
MDPRGAWLRCTEGPLPVADVSEFRGIVSHLIGQLEDTRLRRASYRETMVGELQALTDALHCEAADQRAFAGRLQQITAFNQTIVEEEAMYDKDEEQIEAELQRWRLVVAALQAHDSPHAHDEMTTIYESPSGDYNMADDRRMLTAAGIVDDDEEEAYLNTMLS